MTLIEKKITFGLIVGTRGIFNPALAKEGRQQLLAKLDALGYNYVIPAEDATPNGAVETVADARICADVFDKHRQKIDGVIVVLPNFGDELGVINTLQFAKLNVPVLVQACDDDLDKVDVAGRRDAFCGKVSVCNNLYQYDIPFTDTTFHTCAINSDVFEKDIHTFAKVCRVVKGLTNARIGAIGARPAAFQTVRFSEKLLQTTGITIVTEDLSEIIAASQKFDAQAREVQKKLTEIRAYGKIADYIPEDQILRQAKLSVVLDQWMEENQCDASAIQCWESIQRNYGCATCLSMSMMGERYLPSACEVDVTGAVSMYALLLASGNSPGFLDWNNNYGNDRDKCVNTHCSNYPKSFMGADIEIAELDVLGESLGRENSFGAVKGHVAEGQMTYFRMDTDDKNGKLRAYLGEGDFTNDPFDMDGGIAICKIPDLQQLLKHICQKGYEHHVAMVRSRCADVLDEAIGKYLKWDLYYHK